jgi:hypothetical protein
MAEKDLNWKQYVDTCEDVGRSVASKIPALLHILRTATAPKSTRSQCQAIDMEK